MGIEWSFDPARMMPALKHHASVDGEKREWCNNSSKQVVALTSTPFYWNPH
jgi:hypothetical protein